MLASCKHSNLFINDKYEVEASKENFDNRLGVWIESNNRAVAGHSRGEMQMDSTYRMQTLDGWMMTVRFENITWAQQLRFGLPPYDETYKLKSFSASDHGF